MATITPTEVSPIVEPPPPDPVVVARRKRKVPSLGVVVGSAWLLGLAFCAFFAGGLSFIRDPTTKLQVNGKATRYNLGPGLRAWLGTDKSANDVFAKCIAGARITLEIGVLSTVIGLILGGLLGVLAGYYRGWVDRVVSILTDSLLALPALLLALLLIFRMDQLSNTYSWLSWFGRQSQITATLAILATAPLARIVRAQTLAFREREFVLAARSLGAKNRRIILREILPNLVPAMLTVAFTSLGLLIAAEGALAFLGLGVVETATWGKMIAAGQPDLSRAWWPTIFPCLFLFFTVVSFNLIGDRLARRFDIREAAI